MSGRVMVGAPLRDAAVDPQPVDFCPPLNAGQVDPHSPLCIAIEVGSLEYQRRVDAARAAGRTNRALR